MNQMEYNFFLAVVKSESDGIGHSFIGNFGRNGDLHINGVHFVGRRGDLGVIPGIPVAFSTFDAPRRVGVHTEVVVATLCISGDFRIAAQQEVPALL